MSKVSTKSQGQKSDSQASESPFKDAFFYVLTAVVVILALSFSPQLIGSTTLSFLAVDTGLNKLISVIVSALSGWLCLLPSSGYRRFVELAKGASVEWRKTIKPDRDTVTRTTAVVMLVVFLFAMLILLLDWLFGSIVRAFVG